MKRLILLVAALVSGCAGFQEDPQYARLKDRYGNIYPQACVDLSVEEVDAVLATTIYREAPANQMPFRWVGRTLIMDSVGHDPAIFVTVREGQEWWQRQDTRKHEACHVLMYRETGNAQWHGR